MTPALNEHIAKISVLSRVDRFCVFSQSSLALIKCWNSATSAICRRSLEAMAEQSWAK